MRKTACSIVATALVIAGGCASVSTPASLSNARVDDTDYQKIQLVEQWAARSNVTVVWVNRPTRQPSAVVNQ